MQRNKPKPPNLKRPGQPEPSPSPPPKRVVTIHCWTGSGSKTVHCYNRSGRLVLESEAGDGEGNRQNGIYRIVFYEREAADTPLLVLDVNPKSSVLVLSGSTSINIKTNLFFAFNSCARLQLESNVVVDGQTFRHTLLTLKNEKCAVTTGTVNLFRNVPVNKSDKLESLLKDQINTPPLEIQSQNSSVPPLPNIQKLASIILDKATNMTLPARKTPNCESGDWQKADIKFRNAGAFYGIHFELITGDLTKCTDGLGKSKFRTFWQSKDADKTQKEDEGYEYASGESPQLWKLIQRPAGSINTRPIEEAVAGRVPAAQWILHLQGVPTSVAVKSWNRLVPDYHSSLNRVQGGRPVSFLPILNPATGGFWAMTYRLEDRVFETTLEEKDILFVEYPKEQEGKDKVAIHPLSLHFSEGSDSLTGALRQIKDLDGSDIRGLKFPLRSLDNSEAKVNENQKDFESKLGVVFNCGDAVTLEGAPKSVRMGALDVILGKPATVKSGGGGTFSVRREGREIGIHIDAEFQVADIEPGGQDDPAGEEYVPDRATNFGSDRSDQDAVKDDCYEASFRRKRPIIINPAPSIKKKNLFLRVREDVAPHQSQAVRLEIKTTDASEDKAKRTIIVLDSNPFLVAQVRYMPFDRAQKFVSNVIATWDNTESEGANWKLQFNEQPFDLILPPQGVGEEMVKYEEVRETYKITTQSLENLKQQNLPQEIRDKLNSLLDKEFREKKEFVDELRKVIGDQPTNTYQFLILSNADNPIKPLSFNFSPPARLELDPRVARTRFIEAPWNLRRILGTPGQPMAGPLVKSIQYELLYGLSCDAKNPAVRLAEIFSRVGRIAARREKEMQWKGTEDQLKAYLIERYQWANIYKRYLSRVSVLQPWDSIQLAGEPDTVILNKDCLSCQFRLPDFSNMANPFDPADGRLRGGAAWGFESKNVYDAIVAKPADRNSSSAELSDFYLSSLGGWGHQMAGFQNDLTKIYADVAMGRTYRYKLERIGRIGVFWNLAKHVIVYERTVIPSRQFFDLQNPLTGWPVIRKVREYVEILEETRPYPDDPEASAQTISNITKRSRGFVAGCSFPKGAQFNVLSSWGSEVGDYGWKIPLWNPGAQPSDVYPKPKVTLDVVSNLEDTPLVPCEIDEPQNIYFYTQTKAIDRKGELDPSPNRWDPVVGVDYVNAPRPRASQADFQNGETRQFTPDDVPVPAAYGVCTFRLVPTSVPINLVAERADKALGVVLETVTMMRSVADKVTAKENIPTWPKEVEVVAKIGDEITGVYKSFLSRIPLDESLLKGAPGQGTLRDLRAVVSDEVFDKYRLQLDEAKKAVEAIKVRIESDIKDFEGRLGKRLKQDAEEVIKKPLKNFEDRINELLQSAEIDKEKAKEVLRRFQGDIEEKLFLLESLPGAVVDIFARYVELIVSIHEQLTQGSERIIHYLTTSTDGELNRVLAESVARANVLAQQARDLIRTIETIGQRRPQDWIPDPTPFVRKRLKGYIDRFESVADTFLQELKLAADQVSKENALKAIQKFRDSSFVQNDNLKALQELLKQALDLDTSGLDYKATLQKINKEVLVAANWKDGEINKWQQQIQSKLKDLESTVTKEKLEAIRNDLKAWVEKTLQDDVAALISNSDLARRASAAIETLKQSLDDSRDGLDRLRNELTGTLGKAWDNLEALRKELEKQRDQIARDANVYLDQTARQLMQTISNAPIFQQADKTLRLIRAFGEPPQTPRLSFERSRLGYYFDELLPQVDLSPVVSVVNQASNVIDKLKPLGIKMPTTQTLEQLIPPALKGFDLSNIFPNIAGLDLRKLFSGVKLPGTMNGENVKITHGIDEQARRAYVRADVNFEIPETTTLFTIGPVSVQVVRPTFKATSIIDAGLDGSVRRVVNGNIKGDWQMVISGTVLMKFKDTQLSFDDAGGIKFSINPQNIELPGILSMVSELLTAVSKDSGVSIGLLPDRVQALLSLPLPDIQGATTGITNLNISAALELFFAPSFEIGIRFGLARKEAPFAMTFFILGGGGFFEVEARYAPDVGRLTCGVEVGITLSASLAIALGPIKGGVYLYLGVTLRYRTDGRGLTFGILFILRGEVSLLGIVSACISLMFEVTYGGGVLTGRGRLTISIEICWFFTLEIDVELTYSLGSPSGGDTVAAVTGGTRRDGLLLASLDVPPGVFAGECVPEATDPILHYACDYIELFD